MNIPTNGRQFVSFKCTKGTMRDDWLGLVLLAGTCLPSEAESNDASTAVAENAANIFWVASHRDTFFCKSSFV